MRYHATVLPIYILAALIALTTPAFGIELDRAEADLDGDGIDETIAMEYVTEVGDFVLRIDDQEIAGWLEPDLMGFEIVDIDTGDEYVEVVVTTAGPSDDYESIIYGYQDGRIVEMDHITGYVRFSGDGTMLVDNWMGFWMRRDKYVLDPARRLHLVPQELYSICEWSSIEALGLECTVLDPFPIYNDREGTELLEDLESGSFITVIACYDPPLDTDDSYVDYYGDWYLIRSEIGLTGWARLESFWDKLEGLHWAD